MRGANIVFVALAALCWGLSGGIAGILISSGWDALALSFYRGTIGLLIFLGWLCLRPHGSGLNNRRMWFWSAIAGLGVAGNFSFYFVSVTHCNVAIAVTLMYSAPVFVCLVSFALKLERPTVLKWTAIATVMLGIVLLTQVYDLDASNVTLFGVSAGLLAGLSYTIFIFGFKYATQYGSPQAILSIAFAMLATLLVWFDHVEISFAILSTPQWPLIAGLGILGAGVSFTLYLLGLKHTGPTSASIVAMIEPVTAALFGVVVLHESLAGSQMVGMGVIIITVTVLSIYSKAEPAHDLGSIQTNSNQKKGPGR